MAEKVKLIVTQTYDGLEGNGGKGGLVKRGTEIEVSDKNRAAFLVEFNLAKPVDDKQNISIPEYTKKQLDEIEDLNTLRDIAKAKGVKNFSRQNGATLRKNILAKQDESKKDEAPKDQEPAAIEPEAGNDQEPANDDKKPNKK